MSAPHPPAEAHCATCSCVPGMTPAIRFDTTPAEREGVVRDHLIRMGWTPPAEAQPVAWRILWSPDFPETCELTSDGERVLKVQALDDPPYIQPLYAAPPEAQAQGGGEVVAPGLRDAIDTVANNLGEALEGCRDYDTAVAAITPYINELFALAAVKVTAPPSAPVGLEGVVDVDIPEPEGLEKVVRDAVAAWEECRSPMEAQAAMYRISNDLRTNEAARALAQQPAANAERAFFAQDFYEEAREGKKPWPAQQPAAVDGAMLERVASAMEHWDGSDHDSGYYGELALVAIGAVFAAQPGGDQE